MAENRGRGEAPCPSGSLSTTDLIRTGLRLNQCLRVNKPAVLFHAKLAFVLTLSHTQPPVRRSEPSMSLLFSSSFLSVDGITCHISF
jgi:hypothetical protein